MSGERSRRQLRPSRAERAPYTDALAQAVAEGRLTTELYEERLVAAESATTFADLDELVTDVPFDPPDGLAHAPAPVAKRGRGKSVAGLAVLAVLAGGLTFTAVLQSEGVGFRADSGSSSGGGDSGSDAEAPAAGDGDLRGPEDLPDPEDLPAVAEELDVIPPLAESTLSDALARAHDAGLTEIEQVSLRKDATSVIGLDEHDQLRQLNIRSDTVGTVTDTSGNATAFLDEEALDLSLEEAIAAARAAEDVEGDHEVGSILVYRGDGTAARRHEEGNLVQVTFDGGPAVTLRAGDLSAL